MPFYKFHIYRVYGIRSYTNRGKQYKVSKDSVLSIEKMSAKDAPASGWEVGSKISFDKVLLVDDGKNTTIGTPYIVGAKVNAEILEIGRAKNLSCKI